MLISEYFSLAKEVNLEENYTVLKILCYIASLAFYAIVEVSKVCNT